LNSLRRLSIYYPETAEVRPGSGCVSSECVQEYRTDDLMESSLSMQIGVTGNGEDYLRSLVSAVEFGNTHG
jgi:hypothetical protein